jgi:hypothetical protein
MKIPSKTVLIAVIILCSVASSYAWLRARFSDAQVVSRAELIVVGHIRDGSVTRVTHPKDVVGAQSWEHHVDLIISEVLKGTAPSNSMVVSIHYGLEPMADHFGRGTNGVLEIYDTADIPRCVSGDIHTNQIWLLRRVPKPVNDDTDWIGIYDPEDIQPISKKSELMTYLK